MGPWGEDDGVVAVKQIEPYVFTPFRNEELEEPAGLSERRRLSATREAQRQLFAQLMQSQTSSIEPFSPDNTRALTSRSN